MCWKILPNVLSWDFWTFHRDERGGGGYSSLPPFSPMYIKCGICKYMTKGQLEVCWRHKLKFWNLGYTHVLRPTNPFVTPPCFLCKPIGIKEAIWENQRKLPTTTFILNVKKRVELGKLEFSTNLYYPSVFLFHLTASELETQLETLVKMRFNGVMQINSKFPPQTWSVWMFFRYLNLQTFGKTFPMNK